MSSSAASDFDFELAVVVPVHNEADNIDPLIDEIVAALEGKLSYQMVYVDDGSTDETPARLVNTAKRYPHLEILRHQTCSGQSAAVATGVRYARARFIATLDGDGQNDPANIPALLDVVKNAPDPDFVLAAGWRHQRKDTEWKRFQSKLGNAVRKRLLKDGTPDTGCGLKVFTRAAFLDMPRFDHMHRFLPALMIRRGGRVESVKVNHRHRERGVSKYGMWDRLWVSLFDIAGIIWLNARASRSNVDVVHKAESGGTKNG